MGDNTLRNETSPFGHFYLGWTILISSKLTCMVTRMHGGLYFSVEIELKTLKIPPITNLKLCTGICTLPVVKLIT